MLQRRSLEEQAHHQQRWPAGWPTPIAGWPRFVADRSLGVRADHHRRAKVPPVSEVMECAWEGAPIGHAYTPHYGDPHTKEGDHQTLNCGPFK
jgi:hypothetical protein